MSAESVDDIISDRNRINELYVEEGLKRRTAEARVGELEAGIKKAIAECDECGGQGYNVIDCGGGDIDKDPCNSCWDLRKLVGDHTDYSLAETTSGAAPAPEVGPTGTCQKTELCMLGDGHQGECDDVPF
jgi:hypothetical protein